MQPNRLGRVLGISARIAAEKFRESKARMDAAAAQAHSSASQAPPRAQASRPDPAVYAQRSRRVAREAGRVGAAFLRPFAHATGILWYQIAGVFFALFTLFFFAHAWQAWRMAGTHDRRFVLYAGVGLLFAWFAISSFWRAKKRQQPQPRRYRP